MTSPLEGWSIVLLGARTLVGKRDHVIDRLRLAPVYELHRQLVPNGQGGISLAQQVLPLLALSSVDRIDLPLDTPHIPCESLSPAERRAIAKGVDGAADLSRTMRAAESGIVLAANGTLPQTRRPQ